MNRTSSGKLPESSGNLPEIIFVFTSDAGTLSSSDALNLTDQLDGTEADAEKFFARLEHDK